MKKELKQEVLSKYVLETVKTKGSYVFVQIACMVDGKEYRAFDFAKWSTQDMKFVETATRLYQYMLKENCGCRGCRLGTKHLASLIEKYNWSDSRGVKIATGRAVADIVGQVLGDRSADNVLGKESNPGLSPLQKPEKPTLNYFPVPNDPFFKI